MTNLADFSSLTLRFFLGECSQSKKKSEIRPPLGKPRGWSENGYLTKGQ